MVKINNVFLKVKIKIMSKKKSHDKISFFYNYDIMNHILWNEGHIC